MWPIHTSPKTPGANDPAAGGRSDCGPSPTSGAAQEEHRLILGAGTASLATLIGSGCAAAHNPHSKAPSARAVHTLAAHPSKQERAS